MTIPRFPSAWLALAASFALVVPLACSSDAAQSAPDAAAGADPGDAGSGGIATSGSGGTGTSGTGGGLVCVGEECGDAGPGPSACGDGALGDDEACDDGNASADDGCAADCLGIEPGYACPRPGQRCVSIAVCGDGVMTGQEQCEPDLASPAEACTGECTIAEGYACDAGLECHPTTCGDGTAEGSEQCDDGNFDLGDGCTPECRIEPICRDADGSTRACASTCGDGFKLPTDTNEQCDDGNSLDGDGCSSECQIEDGFECTATESTPLPELRLPVVLRDFMASDVVGGHADFEHVVATESGIVEATLGGDGKPVYNEAAKGVYGGTSESTNGTDWFDRWYHDSRFSITEVQTLTLAEIGGAGSGEYQFSDTTFFPLDAGGWVAAGDEQPSAGEGGLHNFYFTSEVRYWFEYQADEVFTFTGDDDVFVFVNGVLIEDIGGVHGALSRTFAMADRAALANLEVGSVYEIVVFQAERHTEQSNYTLTLAGFSSSTWDCAPVCGDGIVTIGEECDDGVNDGGYGECAEGCVLGEHCGDGVVQTPPEDCDDGNRRDGDACGSSCRMLAVH